MNKDEFCNCNYVNNTNYHSLTIFALYSKAKKNIIVIILIFFLQKGIPFFGDFSHFLDVSFRFWVRQTSDLASLEKISTKKKYAAFTMTHYINFSTLLTLFPPLYPKKFPLHINRPQTPGTPLIIGKLTRNSWGRKVAPVPWKDHPSQHFIQRLDKGHG